MNKRDLADRFSGDVDQMLGELGVTDTEPASKEYRDMLAVARQLASADFSRQSKVRHSLRRRLLNRVGQPPVTAVDVPGPLGMMKRLFKREKSYEYRPARRHWTRKHGLVATAFMAVLLAVLVVSPLGTQLGQQTLTLAARFFPQQFQPVEDSRIPVTFVAQWDYRGEAGISSSPVVSADRLYVGSNSGQLYALDAPTGRELWQFQTDDVIEAAPVTANGLVFAAGLDGLVYALSAETGREQWRFKADGVISASPAVADGLVYVGSRQGYLYAIDANTGREQWRAEIGGLDTSAPTISGGVVYIGSRDWNLYALEAQTGQERWRFKTGDWILSSPLAANGTVYVGSNDQYLYALNAETGAEKWRFFAGDDVVSSPALANGLLYFGSYDGHLYAVEAVTGWEVWRFKTGKPVKSSPVVASNTVYFGSGDGYLYAVDAATGRELARFEAGSQIYTTPAVAGSTIYSVDGKGRLHTIESVPVLPEQQTRIPDGTSEASPNVAGVSDFQFTPGAWYVSAEDNAIRFHGQIVNESGAPVNGFSVQIDNGRTSLLSKPSGPNQWQPDAPPGAWTISLSNPNEQSGWWWLTVVRYECSPGQSQFNPQCSQLTPLSESVKVNITFPNESSINADWICHRECGN